MYLGDWAVAGCVLKRGWRDVIRRLLGRDLLLVTLSMCEEATERRLRERHQHDQREVRWLQVN